MKRRDFLKIAGGIVAGAFVAGSGYFGLNKFQTRKVLKSLGSLHKNQDFIDRIEYRTLGNTGLKISSIGLGGHSYMSNCKMRPPSRFYWGSLLNRGKIIKCAYEHGINYFDSAGLFECEDYGYHIKRWGLADKVYLATWIPYTKEPTYEFTENFIAKAIKNYGVDHIDVARITFTKYIHDWELHGKYFFEALDIVKRLKEKGIVRFIGYTEHSFDVFSHLIDNYKILDHIDVIQFPYNYLLQAAREKVIPLAHQKGVGIIVKKIFGSGFLITDDRGSDEFFNVTNDEKSFLKQRLGDEQKEITAGLVRFAVEDKRITCALVGVANEAELKFDLMAANNLINNGNWQACLREKLKANKLDNIHGYEWFKTWA